MPNDRDMHSWHEVVPIIPEIPGKNADPKDQLGSLVVEYEVRSFTDVRSLESRRAYRITCVQRIIMPNPAGKDDVGPISISAYDYPAMLISDIAVEGPTTCHLVEYSPKTLNSAVSTTSSGSQGADNAVTQQHTSGSSTSETSSWNVSLTSLSANYEHGSTQEWSQSDTSGRSTSTEVQSASSDTMSIKDWNVCSAVDLDGQSLTWYWGQQYPWDVLTHHDIDPTTKEIALPSSVHTLLCDDTAKPPRVFPPSQLSLFGVNLVSKASWVCREPAGAPDEPVQFTHLVHSFQGHHGYDGEDGKFHVRLHVNPDFVWQSPALELATLALDAVSPVGGRMAALGFVRSHFMYFADGENSTSKAVADGVSQFCLRSRANNLLVRGNGFTIPVSNDAPMTADLGDAGAALTLLFKVADEDTELSLYLKHWKTTPLGCTMSIAVNDNAPIVRHIDALESGSGTNNILRVILRSTDYTSNDYYDYLHVGLNRIDIQVTPESAAQGGACGYAIRALAIA